MRDADGRGVLTKVAVGAGVGGRGEGGTGEAGIEVAEAARVGVARDWYA
jgi:hypothetical protein